MILYRLKCDASIRNCLFMIIIALLHSDLEYLRGIACPYCLFLLNLFAFAYLTHSSAHCLHAINCCDGHYYDYVFLDLDCWPARGCWFEWTDLNYVPAVLVHLAPWLLAFSNWLGWFCWRSFSWFSGICRICRFFGSCRK